MQRLIPYVLSAGDSGHVLYSNLSSGSYVFSVLARTRFGEKAVVRRIVHVGMSTFGELLISFNPFNQF